MTFPPSLQDISDWGDSLPEWWDVDDTPGTEGVQFNGPVIIDSNQDEIGLVIKSQQGDNDGGTMLILVNSANHQPLYADSSGDFFLQFQNTNALFGLFNRSNVYTLRATDGKLGFYNTAPQSKPTGVAISAAGVHAALVTLGLIGA